MSSEELLALQTRLAKLHDASLLSDGELVTLEDHVADYIELKVEAPHLIVTSEMISALPASGDGRWEAARALAKIHGFIAAIPGDAALARQLRRKILQ